MKKFLLNLLLILNLLEMSWFAYAVDTNKSKSSNPKLLEGKIDSPYEACRDVLIVSQKKYYEHKAEWDQVEKKCNLKIQFADDVGITSLNPLKEGIEYLTFAQKVAQKVIENLKKNRHYSQCSARCFSGEATCQATATEEAVQCSERKKEIQEVLKVFSRKIRMELALSADAPGAVNVNIRNVLNVNKDKLINSDLRDFEIGTPNPVGRIDLSDRELNEAKRRSAHERKVLEEEFKEKGFKNYSDWMSIKLMEKFNEHRARYRELIYEEAPIFAVVDRPLKMKKGEDPFWSDSQLAQAFLKLAKNSISTEEKINWSLNNSKLEFSRANGEAFGKWMSNLGPGTKEKNDLLYYIGMKNQVEEILKNDPSSCGIATSMEARIHTKEMQNGGITFAATIAVSGGASFTTRNIFKIGMALSGAQAAGITGMALGASYLGDSFRQFNITTTEAATLSGLGGNKEGKAIRKSEEITLARDNAKMALMLTPVDAISGWSLTKILYKSLSKQMAKDLPGVADVLKQSHLNEAVKDQLIDQWLSFKIQRGVKSGVLTSEEQTLLISVHGKKVLNRLAIEIEKMNPVYFTTPRNMDYFLKNAAMEAKALHVSPLLEITPENYSEYAKKIVTIGKTYKGQDSFPLKYATRYEVSPELPKLMLFQTSKDGIHEMREFNGKSRYFKALIADDKIVWLGVEAPLNPKWIIKTKADSLHDQVSSRLIVDYSKVNRKELIEKLKKNAGEASKTVNDRYESNPARTKAASENLGNAFKYLLELNDSNSPLTVERLENLHLKLGKGAMRTDEGNFAVGILRGSPPRIVSDGNKTYFVDVSQLSLRMGEQKVMSYTAPSLVRQQIEAVISKINKVGPNTATEEVAKIYTQITMIHPFVDGNGRLSRVLLQYMLIKMKAPLKAISESEAFMGFYLTPLELAQIIF